jgi:hypothetical protein
MTGAHGLFRQASDYTGFHKKLGVLVEPYLDRGWDMADIGCGLALIDFHLAGAVNSITAIDRDESALAEVEKHIDDELAAGRRDAGKIHTLMKDASVVGSGGEQWDAVLLSFFSAPIEETFRLLSLARHRGVIITRGKGDEGIFDIGLSEWRGESSAEQIEEQLRRGGYGFRKSALDLQFGQPFRTIDEIHEFLRSYEAERLIYSVEDRIIKTKRYDFPYYLPRNMRVTVFIVACHAETRAKNSGEN